MPLFVKQSNDKYELVDGLKRIKAAMMLDMDTIPVVIQPDNIDAKTAHIHENMNRDQLDDGLLD